MSIQKLTLNLEGKYLLNTIAMLRWNHSIKKEDIHIKKKNLKEEINKVSLPKFDGSKRTIAQSWVQILDTYISLNPMIENGAIQFVVLHLRGIAQDWWQHGLHNQGHKQIKSYDEFTQKIIKWFDQVDPEWYFKRLTQIK